MCSTSFSKFQNDKLINCLFVGFKADFQIFLYLFALAKLRELNANAPEDHRLNDEVLNNLEKLLLTISDSKSQDLPTPDQISILWRTSHWPEGMARIQFITAEITTVSKDCDGRTESY